MFKNFIDILFGNIFTRELKKLRKTKKTAEQTIHFACFQYSEIKVENGLFYRRVCGQFDSD